MRAQPRRRKEVKDEPIFLRKTYEMINSCEDVHAAWTAAGDTFVIKDPDTFANEVIPLFFKREQRILGLSLACPSALHARAGEASSSPGTFAYIADGLGCFACSGRER